MTKNFRWTMGIGMSLAAGAGFFYGLECAIAIAEIVGTIGLIWLTIHLFTHCPSKCRWQLFAAMVWTIITAITTFLLIKRPWTATPINYLVLLVAGLTFIPAWRQWIERRQNPGSTIRHRSLVTRLYVQTLWGPLALWGLITGIGFVGQQIFEISVARGDITTARFMQRSDVGDINTAASHNGFVDAIKRQDVKAVAAYCALGVPADYLYFATYSAADDTELEIATGQFPLGRAVVRDSTAITRLILKQGASLDQRVSGKGGSALHLAVEGGKVEQVRLLLQAGANPKLTDRYGQTAYDIAKKRGDKEITRLCAKNLQPKKL